MRIILVSFMGMLVYRLVMSREASLWCGSMGVFSRSFSRSWAFFTLKEWGRGANWFIFLVNSFDNLYAGALRQFTTGRMGWSVLCIFIRPLMEGAEGFILMYFHLWSLLIRVGLCLIVDLICVWNVFVGLLAFVWNSLFCMKSCSFVSYWGVGSITGVFPLSALVTFASCSFSFLCIDRTIFSSGCMLWVGFCFCRFSMRSAISFL